MKLCDQDNNLFISFPLGMLGRTTVVFLHEGVGGQSILEHLLNVLGLCPWISFHFQHPQFCPAVIHGGETDCEEFHYPAPLLSILFFHGL